MRLYELTTAYQQVFDLLMDEDANLDTLEDTLQAIEGEIEVRVENIGKYDKMLKAYDVALTNEIKKLTEKRDAIEKRKIRIRRFLQSQLELMGKDKIVTPIMTISLQDNPPAVEIEDEFAVPTEFLVIIPEQKIIDKTKVRDALKAGRKVPGARLTQGRSIRIR